MNTNPNGIKRAYVIISNIRFMTWLLLSIGSISAIVSFFDSPEMFGRSGAVLVVVGFIIISSSSLLCYAPTIEGAMIKKNDYAKIMPDRGTELHTQRMNEAMAAQFEERVGIWLTVIGTLIWAYGDKIAT